VTLTAIAELCTRLAQARDSADVDVVLADAARLLGAVGVIVWTWEARARVLTPVLAHGYDAGLLARVGGVRRDAPNAIAAAFRTTQPCVVGGTPETTGALVVPMMAPDGCAGVVAFELQDRAEQQESVAAAARLVTAQLATLVVPAVPMAEAANA
jgi:hypothetical protein